MHARPFDYALLRLRDLRGRVRTAAGILDVAEPADFLVPMPHHIDRVTKGLLARTDRPRQAAEAAECGRRPSR